MKNAMLGVVLDKTDIEYLMNLEDGIVTNRNDVQRWNSLFKIKAVKNKYKLVKWYRLVRVPVLTSLGEDIIDEYRWKSETDPSLDALFIGDDILGTKLWKSFKTTYNL